MMPGNNVFQRSVDQQIAINQARTPSQRLSALCELLDAARAMAPAGPEAQERRRRAAVIRQLEREQWRVRCRQFLATERTNPRTGACSTVPFSPKSSAKPFESVLPRG